MIPLFKTRQYDFDDFNCLLIDLMQTKLIIYDINKHSINNRIHYFNGQSNPLMRI